MIFFNTFLNFNLFNCIYFSCKFRSYECSDLGVHFFWQVLALVCFGLFSEKNKGFLGLDFEDVICTNFHGHFCNQRVKRHSDSKFQSDRRYLAFGSLSKNCSSFTANRVEKCSFEKNVLKSLNSACLLSEA